MQNGQKNPISATLHNPLFRTFFMTIEERLRELKEKIHGIVPQGISVSQVEFEGPELRHLHRGPEEVRRPGRPHQDPGPGPAEADRGPAHRPRGTGAGRDRDPGGRPRDRGDHRPLLRRGHRARSSSRPRSPGSSSGRTGRPSGRSRRRSAGPRRSSGPRPSSPPRSSRSGRSLRSVKEERKTFLRAIGRRIHREATSKDQWVRVTTLGLLPGGGPGRLPPSPPRRARSSLTAARNRAARTAPRTSTSPEIHPLSQPRRRRPHPRPPGPLRPRPAPLQVRLRRARVQHPADEGPLGHAPARLPRGDPEGGGETAYTSTDVKNYIRHSITLNYGAVTDIAPDIKLTFHNAGPHPRLGHRPLPHRRRPLQHRLHRRLQLQQEPALLPGAEPVPPARDGLHGVHLRRVE